MSRHSWYRLRVAMKNNVHLYGVLVAKPQVLQLDQKHRDPNLDQKVQNMRVRDLEVFSDGF